jgi:hypothetical protein
MAKTAIDVYLVFNYYHLQYRHKYPVYLPARPVRGDVFYPTPEIKEQLASEFIETYGKEEYQAQGEHLIQSWFVRNAIFEYRNERYKLVVVLVAENIS